MAAKKLMGFSIDVLEEEIDTTLCLGKDKGKRPLEESPDKTFAQKKKKQREQLKELKEHEETSTGNSAEDRVALLSKKMEGLQNDIKNLENIVRFQNGIIMESVNSYFSWSTKCFVTQNQKHLESQTKIYTSLIEFTKALKGERPEIMLQFTTPKSGPRGPSGTKKPPRS